MVSGSLTCRSSVVVMPQLNACRPRSSLDNQYTPLLPSSPKLRQLTCSRKYPSRYLSCNS